MSKKVTREEWIEDFREKIITGVYYHPETILHFVDTLYPDVNEVDIDDVVPHIVKNRDHWVTLGIARLEGHLSIDRSVNVARQKRLMSKYPNLSDGEWVELTHAFVKIRTTDIRKRIEKKIEELKHLEELRKKNGDKIPF